MVLHGKTRKSPCRARVPRLHAGHGRRTGSREVLRGDHELPAVLRDAGGRRPRRLQRDRRGRTHDRRDRRALRRVRARDPRALRPARRRRLPRARGRRLGAQPTAALFLDRGSPAYLARGSPSSLPDDHRGLRPPSRKPSAAAAPRFRGRHPGADHPVWVEFARAMAPAAKMSGMLSRPPRRSRRRRREAPRRRGRPRHVRHRARAANPRADVVALDWTNVLTVARRTPAGGRRGAVPHDPGKRLRRRLGVGLRPRAAAELPAPLRRPSARRCSAAPMRRSARRTRRHRRVRPR